MIPVTPPTHLNEPPLFNANCRQPGAAWLAAHQAEDPHQQSHWWSRFQPDLARHFNYRCGWLATSIELDGIVEHWLSCGPRQGTPSPHAHLAFEWTNYRYATGVINALKGTLDNQILDPCEVQPDWFEVLLPSFELVPTVNIPDPFKARAGTTIDKLHLRRYTARFTRWRWYERYWNQGNPDLGSLRNDAPLVAAAIEKANLAGLPLPDPATCEPGNVIEQRQRRYAPRRRGAPHAAPAP
jgi:hypothetical protein